jgi:small GTP-binding protein
MVGAPGTGKTSLVQRFVSSIFSERYHSTVGVRIERKQVDVTGTPVNLVLWDLEGQDRFQGVQASYLRGASGLIFVVDGTRRETFDLLAEMREQARKAVGEVPFAVALNKADLTGSWVITPEEESALVASCPHVLQTSAKTGVGVEAMFDWLAASTFKAPVEG